MPRPSTRAAKPPTTSRAPNVPPSERRSEFIRLLAAVVTCAVDASVAKPDQRRAAGNQYFGDAAGDRLKRDRYKEFCRWRADRLAEAHNDWLGID